MRAINLLPKQAVHAGRSGLVGYLPYVGSGAVPVIALILVIVGYSSGSSTVSTRRAELATVNAEVVKLAPVVSTTTAPTSLPTAGLVADRAARLAALQVVLGNEVAWDRTLLDVARVLPSNVWLSSLTATTPTPADAPPPVAPAPTTTDSTATTSSSPPAAPAPVVPAKPATGFTLSGYTYTEADVAAALQRLQLLPTLTAVTLTSVTRADVGTKKLVQFQVTAALQPAQAQSQP